MNCPFIIKAKVPTFALTVLLGGGLSSCTQVATQSKWQSWNDVENDSLVVTIPVCEPKLKNISSLVAEFKYVPLETTKASLFGNIDRMEIYKDRIYLSDYFSAKGVLIFDLNGKFISKAGTNGNGPGEIISADMMFIDSYNDYIVIVDKMQNKLVYYSLLGEYVKEIPFAIHDIGDCASIGKNCIAFTNRAVAHNPLPDGLNRYRIICADTLGNIIGGIYEQEDRINFPVGFFEFLKYKDITYFNPIFTPYIYTIADSTIKKKYVCDYTALNPKEPPLPNNRDDFAGIARYSGGKTSLCGLFVENDSFIAFQTKHDYKDYTTFYDKKSRKAVTVLTHPQYNSDDSCLMAFNWLTSKDDYLVGYVGSWALLYWNKLCIEEKDFSRAPELCSKLQEDDNIVLVFFKLKSIE